MRVFSKSATSISQSFIITNITIGVNYGDDDELAIRTSVWYDSTTDVSSGYVFMPLRYV